LHFIPKNETKKKWASAPWMDHNLKLDNKRESAQDSVNTVDDADLSKPDVDFASPKGL
jgi:hypothetical protein